MTKKNKIRRISQKTVRIVRTVRNRLRKELKNGKFIRMFTFSRRKTNMESKL